jgi:soluble lytic murein transglycosylase-like protein
MICIRTLTLVLLPAALWGQVPQTPDDAAAKQRKAAVAMQESLAKQRMAIEKQRGTTSNGSFFVLPRASSLGTNAPMPISVSMPPAALCDPLPAASDDLNPDLLRTVVQQESAFRPCAVSSKGAMGLMQLMPDTAQDLGVENPFDAASNLDGGARFLKQLLNRYGGDVPKALGAYNAGPAKVDAAAGVPAIPETVEYVRQILSALPFK